MATSPVAVFIEESLMTAVDEIPVFKLSDLVMMYNANLEKLRIHLETRIQNTRFKNWLLLQFKDLSLYKSQKGVILAFKFD